MDDEPFPLLVRLEQLEHVLVGGHGHGIETVGPRGELKAGHAVALQLELDDELRREGLAREIVHAVQIARKDAGLEITDRIALTLTGDEDLLAAAQAHQDYLANEVLATTVSYDGTPNGATAKIDGRDLKIGVSRA